MCSLQHYLNGDFMVQQQYGQCYKIMNKLLLKQQCFCKEMKEDTSVEAQIKGMKELMDRLVAINAPIAEEDQIMMLLGNLTPTYST